MKVHEILHGKFNNALPNLMILPAKDSFIHDLRKYLNTFRAGSSYIRIGGQTFGKRYVTDAFIIRLPGVIG